MKNLNMETLNKYRLAGLGLILIASLHGLSSMFIESPDTLAKWAINGVLGVSGCLLILVSYIKKT